METNTVQMTQEELEQFRAYQAEKARNEAEEKAKEMRESYREIDRKSTRLNSSH